MSTLTRVGSSMMVVIPARIVRAFGFKERDLVEIDVEGDKIVMRAQRRPRRSRYLSADLLAMCDLTKPSAMEVETAMLSDQVV